MPRGIPPLRGHDDGSSRSSLLPWGGRLYGPVVVEGDRYIVRSPCHQRPIRLDRHSDQGVDGVVRCPYCARLWELRVTDIDGLGQSAVWTA